MANLKQMSSRVLLFVLLCVFCASHLSVSSPVELTDDQLGAELSPETLEAELESDDSSSSASRFSPRTRSSADSEEEEEEEDSQAEDSNIENAKIELSPRDQLTASGHHHYHGHGHGPHGWLEMGASTGKKGAFKWHDKHPVGGKGRR